MSSQEGRSSAALLVLLAAVLLTPGVYSTACAVQVRQQSPDSLAQARALYMQNKLGEALPIFQAVAAKEPQSGDARAWLAETARRLHEFDRAAEAARTALRLAPCHAFAHNVLGDLYRPQWSDWEKVNADSAWTHLLQAAECDSTDGNPWTGIWGEAMRRGDASMESRALRRLVERHFLARSALAYGRWLLRGLPENAVLLTAGDLNTWGVLAIQTVERFRTDVAIVNTSLLNLDWYAKLMSERHGLPLAAPAQAASGVSDTIISDLRAKSLEGILRRPLAATIPQPSGPGRFAFAGSYWLLTGRDSIADTAVIRRAFDGVRGADFGLPVVSPKDRSPIRRGSWIPETLVVAAFHYADILRRAGWKADAARTEAWAQAFGREAGLSSESIEHLRQFALKD
ncbi:MAG: tetratricopeptide repeat protein [Gemmatimonadales bacterium]